MARKNNSKTKTIPSGVMLYAKRSGITSFSSLFSIKHALDTDKVGHTGTLDSFADGLLVVLTGSLTHLVPHITGFTKTYRAVVCFGKETDTLDPTGEFIKTGSAPSRQQVEEVLKSFEGTLLQVPPVYSAVHVNGKRASNLARDGKDVKLEPRQIFVYKNELLDFQESSAENECSYALLEIKCSKGTYIRALARDIAAKLGTCGHLCGLRRIQVGPFKLEDAACYNELEPFTIQLGIDNENREQERRKLLLQQNPEETKKKAEKTKDPVEKVLDIKNHFQFFTPELAAVCGFEIDTLNQDMVKNYLNGRPLSSRMFTRLDRTSYLGDIEDSGFSFPDEIAVFYENFSFAGMIKKTSGRLSYGFVVPPEKQNNFAVFYWDEIIEGKFPVEYLKKGTALTVGSFDGMHAGHQALVKAVCQNNNLAKGLVTFRTSYKAVENSGTGYAGDVLTLRQKLDLCRLYGLDFAIVIDFSEDFSKIEGHHFVELLTRYCGMKFMAEGQDFCCGYKGAFGMQELTSCSRELGFKLAQVDDVIFDGQRISSSRIRKAVKNGRFLDVQKMLGSSFSIDGKSLQWEEDGSAVICQQVSPSDGNYDCVAIIKPQDDSCENNAVKSICSIEKGRITITLSEDEKERLVAINFVPVNKSNDTLA